ncbi:MAG: response regulator [Bacteroidetes bacterium]|nr:response regulator [Bacteroidota bacterium]
MLRKIIYPKFSEPIQEIENRRLSTLHRVILASILISIVFIVLQAINGLNEIVYNNLPITATYIFCLYLFNTGQYNTSRNVFLISINAFVYLSNLRAGNDSGIFLFFFPIAAGTFFLFTEKEKHLLIAVAALPVVLFLSSLTFHTTIISSLPIPEHLIKRNYIFCAAISITITLYCIYYYLKLYHNSTLLIKSQKASLKSLIENIGDPICQFDLDFNVRQYNESFSAFMLTIFNVDIKLHPSLTNISRENTSTNQNQEVWKNHFKDAFNGSIMSTETQFTDNGRTLYFELKINPVKVNSIICGAVMTLKDITSRVNNEQLLKRNLEEKQKLSTVANTIKHSILITDNEFKVTWTNPFFKEITKFTAGEIMKQPVLNSLCGPLTDTTGVNDLLKDLASGRSSTIETILYKKNKEPFWSYISSSPVYDDNNCITGHIFIALDITDRKRSEEQLQLLLTHAQKLNKELTDRDTELQASIRKLNKQSWEIQISKQHLQKKKSELEESNKELNIKARKLEQNNSAIVLQNKELEEARKAISQKAELLEQVSKYKSEFLANMSHELRTPLNSIIILSRLLAENKDSNLNRKQIEFAHVVHKSGTDLLNLINDILDLSKIEAGKIEIEKAEFEISPFCKDIWNSIQPTAKSKNIHFSLQNNITSTPTIFTDEMRLSQILKNLLSNAIKFTSPGGNVCLTISEQESGLIRFEVKDDGIGIPEDKQKLIFESFKQVDGSISRRFGGTGLGLSISKELTHLLSGKIAVISKEGEGSTFIVEIPIGQTNIHPGITNERRLLIIEDDETFAKILEKMALREGFKTEICHRGDTGYLRIKESKPDAVLLDMNLPGINGWNLIKRIRSEKDIAQIPIHVVSSAKASDSPTVLPFVSWFEKPASTSQLTSIFRNLKNTIGNNHKVLVIEDSPEQSMVVKQMLKRQGITCEIAETGMDGISKLIHESFDCIILDLNLPDSDGMALLKQFKEAPEFSAIPVIVYSSRELNDKEKLFLKDYASSYINKNTDHIESLLEETTLFLQSVQEQKNRSQFFGKLPDKKKILNGKKVLVVDDDARNIYALSSMLELYGMEIHTENDGASAVKYLEKNPNTDLVLMDIMMPGMNGYEATKSIRRIEHLSGIPIIAVTAKAMKGDREHSLSCGMDEHITKPIEGNSLITIISNFFQ